LDPPNLPSASPPSTSDHAAYYEESDVEVEEDAANESEYYDDYDEPRYDPTAFWLEDESSSDVVEVTRTGRPVRRPLSPQQLSPMSPPPSGDPPPLPCVVDDDEIPAVPAALRDPDVLRRILSELPGVDPTDPIFAPPDAAAPPSPRPGASGADPPRAPGRTASPPIGTRPPHADDDRDPPRAPALGERRPPAAADRPQALPGPGGDAEERPDEGLRGTSPPPTGRAPPARGRQRRGGRRTRRRA
jgi:hypothetical protein